ncbi:MAG: Rap1a/Tai family immunity protein [Thalassotalea sp.]|nr:Rap1a/Tai family immunity protein [Thalassotalea sp.]
MKTLKKLMLNVVAISACLSPSIVLADYKSDIIDSCSAYQTGKDLSEVNACKLYIDGFIDASLLSEAGIVKPKAMIEKQQRVTSPFLQRAYQTRLLTTSSTLKNENSHEFCIPREYERKNIASSLAKSMDINQLNSKSLKEVLFDTLIIDFPCNKTS